MTVVRGDYETEQGVAGRIAAHRYATGPDALLAGVYHTIFVATKA